MPPRSTTWPRRTRGAVCLAFAMLVVLPAGAHATAPANDAFASAQVVQVGDRATGTLVDATLETGEPATSSELIDHTVWYRLKTSTTERVRLDTCGGNPYSELQVFTGTPAAGPPEDAGRDGAMRGPALSLLTTTRAPCRRTHAACSWTSAAKAVVTSVLPRSVLARLRDGSPPRVAPSSSVQEPPSMPGRLAGR